MSVFLNPTTAVISTANSSTTNLAVGNSYTFTGTAEQTFHPDLMLNLYADQPTTIRIQFSQDGTNWDSTLTKYGVSGANEFTTSVKGARYVRVVVFTDSLTTTVFRLQTQYGIFRQGNSSLNSALSLDADALTVRPTDYKYEVALGRRQQATTWNKWGYNGDLDIGTETIWSYGGIFTPLSTGSVLLLSSSAATDASGSSGATSVVIQGVDSLRNNVTDVVTLQGTTVVSSSLSFAGVNRVSVYAAGVSGSNQGNITVHASSNQSVQAHIPAGEGTTQQAIFFTAANNTILMDWMLINVTKLAGGQAPKVTIKAWVTSFVSGAKYEVFRHTIDTTVENTVELRPSQPFPVGEKSIIEFQATTDKDDTIVSLRFSLIDTQNI